MKYIKLYEDIFDNSKYKQYIITKFIDKGIYINLYENLYHTMNKNSFRALYYYDPSAEKIEEYINKQEIDYIPIDFIVYESNDLEDALKTLEAVINTDKYNL
jgi:hypothetical protein